MEALGFRSLKPPPNNADSDEEINVYFKIIKTLMLKMNKSTTITNVKTLISEKEGITEKIEAFFKGDQLSNDKSLVDYGVLNNSAIDVHVQNHVPMNLFINIPANKKTISVETKDTDTVKTIKSMIGAQEDIKPKGFTLIYKGQLLKDDNTLAFLNIPPDSTLQLILGSKDVMRIFVRTHSGEIMKLKVKPMFTVRDVKAIIEGVKGISLRYHGLYCEGNPLRDCDTLALYDINKRSKLQVSPSPFQIFVKIRTGHTITLHVYHYYTAADVKGKIFHKVKIPTPRQRLYFQGRLIKETRSLLSYNIEKECILELRGRC